MPKPKKKIGILGGMGPLASATFYKDVVDSCVLKFNAQQDYEFPKIYLYSLPLTGFSERGFEEPELVRDQLVDAVKELEEMGCDFISIACNTVHHFHSDMQKAVEIKVLNIVEETVNEVKSLGIKTVGIMSSESTRNLGLYEKELKRNKVKAIHVDDKEQRELNQIILNIMGGKLELRDEILLKMIMNNLMEKGSEAIILGCTELPLLVRNMNLQEIMYLDSLKILANKSVDLAYNVE